MTAPLAADERWTINDVTVHGPDTKAWWIGQGAGLAMTPDTIDQDVTVPYRHGDVEGLGVTYSAGQLVMTLCVLGVDPDTGLAPSTLAGSLAVWDDNINFLAALVHARTLVVRRYRPDGSARVATGRLQQALSPERQRSQPVYGELQIAVKILNAFWHDTDPVTSTIVCPTSGAPQPLWELAGATAPMDDLDIAIGPAWNPVLTDVGSGSWVAYDAVIQSGQALRLDCVGRRVYGEGGLIVDQALVRRGGVRGRLFELAPGQPPRIAVESSGPDPVSVQVSGRRAYLTA